MENLMHISQYWDTEVIPDYMVDLLATFRDQNPDFNHCVYSESAAVSFISEHFGPRETAAFKACAVPTMQSDYFRYCAVLALGGIYVDADYECNGSLWPFLDQVEGGEIFLGAAEQPLNGRKTRRVWSSFFGFRDSGHPFLQLALEIATANVEARIADQVWAPGEKIAEAIWCTVGPGVFTLMRFMHDWGSFDVFLDELNGTPAEPFGELYCEVVGNYSRLVEAFEGVCVSPYESMAKWITYPKRHLPYKDTDSYWAHVTTGIFR